MKKFFIFLILFIININLYSLTLDLKTAIQIGIKNNKELLIAESKLKSAEANLKVARSSFFPSIEAKGTYTYLGVVPESEMKALGYVPMPTPTDPFKHTHTLESVKLKMARENNYEASLNLTQPIFMWGRLVNNYKFAKIQYEIERENYKKTRLKVIKDIKNAFYSYLLAQKNAELMEESYNQLKENVKSAEINYKSGVITKYDFMALQIQLVNMEPSVVQAKSSVEIAKENLKNIIGLETDDFSIVGEFNFKKVDLNFEDLKEQVLNNNPDLKIISLQKEAMDKLISINRSMNKPSLMGIFSYKYKYIPEDEKAFGESQPDSWNVTLALTVPISEWFPWSKTSYEIDKSKYNFQQVELTYKNIADFTLLRLKQLLIELNTQYEMIEGQRANVENAKETYEFRTQQYKRGLIRYTELIDSQVSLTKAEVNYLQVLFKYIMAKVGIDELSGIENLEEF